MSVSSASLKPVEDFVIIENDSKTMAELKSENLHLRIENRTLLNNIMEQQKEIMRLQQVVLDQNKEFHEALSQLTVRQLKLEEKIRNSEDKSKIAMASTAISIVCAVIGGTCGFSGAYKIMSRVVASLAITDTSVAAGCAVVAATANMVKV